MGQNIVLTADDGHELDSYLAIPSGPSKASIVIIQEIFGVNKHIKNVVDNFAARGFAVIAPSMFDRVKKNISLSYTSEDVNIGRDLMQQISWEEAMLDVKAATSHIRDFGSVGICGYCWGGSVAWVASLKDTGITSAVGYYGGKIIDFVDEIPVVPVLLHFGDLDAGIPIDDVEKIKSTHPNISVHRYSDADHGFNCDLRSTYNADSSKLALERTLSFFEETLV